MATATRDLKNTPQQRLSSRVMDVSDASRLEAGVIGKRMGFSQSKMTHFRQGARDGFFGILLFAHAVAGEGLLRDDVWGIVRYVIGEPGAELPLRTRLVGDEPAVTSDPDDSDLGGSSRPRPHLEVVSPAA